MTMWRCGWGPRVLRRRWSCPGLWREGNLKIPSNQHHSFRKSTLSPSLIHLHKAAWTRLEQPAVGSVSSLKTRTFCMRDKDPIEIHKEKLKLWFSHLPQEEMQFGGYFSPETMHIDPLILARNPEDAKYGPFKTNVLCGPSLAVEQLFAPTSDSMGQGMNVLLYGAVGTGKSTVVRKLVLDWCDGSTLSQFKLLVPFSCEDLSQLSKSSSLRDLVGRKYMHLRRTPLLSGEANQAKEVLFIFNSIEKMKLDFRISNSELCSDPNEPLPAGTVVVNLLRKYLLPEASILVTTRLSALERIPKKYVTRYAQICGFNDPDRQQAYFTSRLLQSTTNLSRETESLVELLYLNLQRESQLAAACFLPSYCWLTCATLHFLHFTDDKAPIRTLTGIYTSFLRLNFGGEILDTGGSMNPQDDQKSLMLYIVRTVGKLAFDGVSKKRTLFTVEDLEQLVGGKTKTDEELQQLAVFRTDVLDFFLVPSVESKMSFDHIEADEKRFVFAVPAMQEYLAALYVVLGENKTVLEKLSKEVSVAFGQVGDDVTNLMTILSKFIPLRIFALFNLLKLFPSLFEKFSSYSKGHIARTMAAEMFRSEDSYNEDVLDQVEQSLLGVQGPAPKQQLDSKSFELYPIFMGGLLHYGNRRLLDQLGCNIKSTTVAQITRTLKKHLVRESRKKLPPEELMDLLVLLYEFQNPRLTAEVLLSVKTLDLSTVRMTPLKCVVLSSVLSCTSSSFTLNDLVLSSCHLNKELLPMLCPAFRHTRSLKLCDNPLLDSGLSSLLQALQRNRSLRHLFLMHTGMGDTAALELAEKLASHSVLQELNVAYNNIGDSAALVLVDACRDHPSIHTLHLYLNQLSDVGKQSLYVRGTRGKQGGTGRQVKVLASVTEGTDISDQWHPILSIIGKNSMQWERERVREQLMVFLRDLEWGRRQQHSIWKKLYFRRVENGVKQTLRMLEKASALSTKSGPH
ncbi:NLR family member X1 isoform X2 [Denticeps clupeoides]|uniref:NACHT domain-containing protein n=1 Tax=Denticeps clupeoides TaxID=299321 RepID=A0AAY4D7C4_9TELE|nr:NLR family member X1 isoform X2 [Denticeps clupeoides]